MKNTIETLPLTHTEPGHTNKLHMGTSTAGGSRPQIAGVMVRPGRAFGPMCTSGPLQKGTPQSEDGDCAQGRRHSGCVESDGDGDGDGEGDGDG